MLSVIIVCAIIQTKVGTMHPHLDFDLTGAMIEAAHEVGVRAPVYITAGWSDEDAKKHPEWIMVQNKEDIGKRINPLDFESEAKKKNANEIYSA